MQNPYSLFVVTQERGSALLHLSHLAAHIFAPPLFFSRLCAFTSCLLPQVLHQIPSLFLLFLLRSRKQSSLQTTSIASSELWHTEQNKSTHLCWLQGRYCPWCCLLAPLVMMMCAVGACCCWWCGLSVLGVGMRVGCQHPLCSRHPGYLCMRGQAGTQIFP